MSIKVIASQTWNIFLRHSAYPILILKSDYQNTKWMHDTDTWKIRRSENPRTCCLHWSLWPTET